LSAESALKYFGDTDPIGKRVSITFEDKYKETFVVRGVTEKFPQNASFSFAVLLPFEKQLDLGVRDFDDWKTLTRATFVQVNDPDDIDEIYPQMWRYIDLQNSANPDRPMVGFIFKPLLEMAIDSYKVRRDIVAAPILPSEKISLIISALFILILACFNYMNTAISSTTRRLKEIGIRKVVGGKKIQLVFQFMSENLLLCFLGLISGILLAEFLFVPWMNNLFSGSLDLELDFFDNFGLWIFLIMLLLLTGLGVGAYTAFYISAFQPANILGGNNLGGKNRFTTFLLTGQFALAFITIVSSIALKQNNEYQKKRDWGYNQDQVVVVPIDGQTQFRVYENEIQRNPNILKTAGAKDHIAHSRGKAFVEILGTNPPRKEEVARYDVGFDYLETLGLRLNMGRTFNKDLATDIDPSIIVNEMFVQRMGFQQPIGMKVAYDGMNYYIIGVVENFHSNFFTKKIEPTMLRMAAESEFKYIAVKVRAGTVVHTAQYLEATWKKFAPDIPYTGVFQDQVFDFFFNSMNSVSDLFAFTAIISLIITCMGLLRLVSLNIAKRLKEFSISKVLGASVLNIGYLINKNFLKLIVVAVILATPLSYLIIKSLFESVFEYHMPIGPSPFILAFGAIFLTAVSTIFWNVYKAATANPVDQLRSE